MTEVKHISTNISVLESTQAIIVTGTKRNMRPTSAAPLETSSDPWSYWGDDNDFPNNVISDLKGSTIIPGALKLRTDFHFGQGLMPFRIDPEKAQAGKLVKQPVIDPRINDFMRRNRADIQYGELLDDFETWRSASVELIFSRDRTRINRFYVKQMAFCRWEKMNPRTGRIENMYYSGAWPSPNLQKEVAKIPVIDLNNPEESIAKSTSYNMIYPVYSRSIGNVYYPLAYWNGARESFWLDIAKQVPKLKKYLFENQMTIKYLVRIDESYWTSKYGNEFPNWSKEKKAQAQDETFAEINKYLTGTEAAGKSIFSGKMIDPSSQKEIQAITIDVIDDKFGDGKFLPDTAAANSEILFSMRVDPSIIGHGIPGGKNLSGSGSDKTASIKIHQAQLPLDRIRTLDLMTFISNFNGWNPNNDLKWMYIDTDVSQTLDQNPTGKMSVV